MRRAVLLLVLSFSICAAAQKGSVGTTGSGATGVTSAPNVSPGMQGQPASGPAAEAPTTNLGPSSMQPLGTGELTNGSAGTSTTTSTGGFITNSGFGPTGFVPLLQTPSAGFPSPLSNNLPNNPAGISNNPSALQSANLPSNEGVFNTGAADFGMSVGQMDGRSLGEVARDYRARRGSQQAARVFTNADIERLNHNNGQVSLGSNLGPQGSAQPGTQQAPPSPTTPAVNANPAQPGQNQNLPGSEAQPR